MTDREGDIGKDGLYRVAEKPVMSIPELVVEYPLDLVNTTEYVTPEDQLFVLAHLGIPKVDQSKWKLEIAGLVKKALILGYEDLCRFPKRIICAIHQCAGNPMEPTVPTRTISNVEWSGVLLRDILTEAGIKDSCTHLWAYGLDFGTFANVKQEHYVKDLPISHVMAGDVLIATELNGKPLSEKHGFPARLVVPGFYGNNSVKWLCRIELANQRVKSLFTTRFYNDPDGESGASKPVWAIEPESIIINPSMNSTLTNTPVEISGWAWSLEEVTLVEVSVDGGETWVTADLDQRKGLSWQRFNYFWTPEIEGDYQIKCRAIDSDNKKQPLDSARNSIHCVEVTIKK